MNPKLNPIAFGDSLKTILTAALAWLVIMGFWTATPEQQAATLTLGTAIINFGIGYWQSLQTTALADPKDETGEQLVRAIDRQPTRSAKEAGNI